MGRSLHGRPLTARDAVDVYDVYPQGIADRAATFETAPPDPAELAGWPRTGPCVVPVHSSSAMTGIDSESTPSTAASSGLCTSTSET